METRIPSADDAVPARPRHLRRVGCLVVLGAGIMLFALSVQRGFKSKEYFNRADKAAIVTYEAHGVAASLPTFQKKYPSTPRGEAGVKETARIFGQLYYDHTSFTSSTTTLDLTPRSAFRLQYVLENTVGGGISTPTLLAYHDANSTPLRELLSLPNTASFDDLSWNYKSFDDTPVYTKPFLKLRQTSRILLPTAIWLSLQDGDTTSAYTLLLNWMYFGQSLKVAGTSLVDGMVGVAVDGILETNANELLHAAPPPSEEIALQLHDQLDPDRMRRDFLRCCEAEAIWYSQFLRFASGVAPAPPFTHKGWNADFDKHVMGSFFASTARSLKDLSEFRMPRSYPRPAQLLVKFPAFLRRYAIESMLTMFEWIKRNDEITMAAELSSALAMARAAEIWIEDEVVKNPISAIAIPAIQRASMNSRGRRAQAAVLQVACMVRVAELRASDVSSTMPLSLEEIAQRAGKPVPIDPLAATAGATIQYAPHPEDGTYILRHAPSVKPYEGAPPFEYRGKWTPAR